MTRFKHLSQETTSLHFGQEIHHRVGKFLSRLGKHPAEIILLQVLPKHLNIVELFGGIGWQPEHTDEALDSRQLREAPLGLVRGAIVDDQDDSLARPPDPPFEDLKEPDKEAGVHGFRAVREQEGTVGPKHRPTNSHPGVLAGRRDHQGLAPLPIGVHHYGQEVEASPVGKPEFVIGVPIESPFLASGAPFGPVW